MGVSLYEVCAVGGVVTLATLSVYLGIATCTIEKCYREFERINDNLTGINKTLRKISEGKLEKDVKKEAQQDLEH